jgi:hypothetical protein
MVVAGPGGSNTSGFFFERARKRPYPSLLVSSLVRRTHVRLRASFLSPRLRALSDPLENPCHRIFSEGRKKNGLHLGARGGPVQIFLKSKLVAYVWEAVLLLRVCLLLECRVRCVSRRTGIRQQTFVESLIACCHLIHL